MNLVYIISAIAAGLCLVAMIYINGLLAKFTSPTWASFIAHGVGTLFGGLILAVLAWRKKRGLGGYTPKWAYTGGLLGAFTVILGSIAINSQIGVSGTISLVFLGQVAVGLLVDSFGWFELSKRKIGIYDFLGTVSILAGTGILLFLAR